MRRFFYILLCVAVCLTFTACTLEERKTEKLRDIEFTVVDKANLPEELKKEIAAREKKVFKYSYEDQGYLYIIEGYGAQETSGYSIEVAELYETENAIYVRTNLIGPTKEEKIVERKTYPYIVIKIESIDKNVVFQ